VGGRRGRLTRLGLLSTHGRQGLGVRDWTIWIHPRTVTGQYDAYVTRPRFYPADLIQKLKLFKA
jgi:hypothetical protein